MLNYESAVDWIHSRLRLGIKPGLMRMNLLLDELGNPHRKQKTVHIGGTNGKGSTVTYLRNALQEAGYTVGTFTSPYFERFNERISINGHPVSDDDLTRLVEKIKPIAENMEQSEWGAPSEFEIITAMSFYYFAEMNPVDLVLYEVGLGGRLDSTNVITPMISVITSIGMDHMQFLGNRIEDIAYEKAGIIKQHVPVISGVNQPEASKVIEEKALEMGSELFQFGEDFSAERTALLEKGEMFEYRSPFQHDTYELSMIGTHQINNAAIAIKTLELLEKSNGLKVGTVNTKAGLKKAAWPGRMEALSSTRDIYIDGAHNPEGVAALVKTIKERFLHKRVTVLFSALHDKELKPMIHDLEEVVDSIGFTTFDFPRVASVKELYEASSHPYKAEVDDWKEYLMNKVPVMLDDEVLLITGSLYFLSEVKPYLLPLLENYRKK
ncbi:bifunctional folylpolyglutamate synthase/dihydrofolate synthase [Rossellomorea aquimaris]|uniref:bifunctional folylpolyglutamate synthase/dihydrofolate synthase n=1 Tax=Rossellomorea aquimaris TaxID=189382 RepID=UPI001CD3536B|nr:folylpolyglutamate synthase/dihydrofolate synthase family protein [Rossellomorea aquimaris]MCA1057864.1 bifunctional folylpolyglutamate synthase/dihydrofolate synthase [Rossellomorea aquimaris]